MGCLNLPTTLSGWAQYCDCLQPTKHFKHPNQPNSENRQPTETNSQDVQNESQISIKDEKKSKYKVKWEDYVTNNKKHQSSTPKYKPMVVNNLSKRDTIDQISEIPELRPTKDNIFISQQLSQEQQMNEQTFPELYQPVALKNHEKRARVTAPLIQRYLQAQKDNQSDYDHNNKVDLIKNNRSLFLNKSQEQQFNKTP